MVLLGKMLQLFSFLLKAILKLFSKNAKYAHIQVYVYYVHTHTHTHIYIYIYIRYEWYSILYVSTKHHPCLAWHYPCHTRQVNVHLWCFFKLLKKTVVSMSRGVIVPMYMYNCKHTWRNTECNLSNLYRGINIPRYVLREAIRMNAVIQILSNENGLKELVIFTLKNKILKG